MTDNLSSVERLLRHDRQIVMGALILVTVLAWIYTMTGVGMGSNVFEMYRLPWTDTGVDNMTMTLSGLSYIFVLLAMWWVTSEQSSHRI